MSLLSVAFSFFLLMDSIGNLPIFVALLKEIEPKRQKMIILRELVIALVVIVFFYFLGSVFLDLLGIQQAAVHIAGGIVLFMIAIRMVFPQMKEQIKEKSKEEPFIVPMAIPLIAGPAILAAVMLYSHEESHKWTVLSAIFIAWGVSTLILFGATRITKILGWRGITACERLMGLILTLMAVQMFLQGVTACGAKPLS